LPFLVPLKYLGEGINISWFFDKSKIEKIMVLDTIQDQFKKSTWQIGVWLLTLTHYMRVLFEMMLPQM